ncbi:S41 family peptidase [Sulfurimonas sp.]|uniref:S41 family peptidase n=1 Tax=Sulfurimonas sp. TaxID=2022749 RepID=UPI0025F100B2|nr:S41 family peptidase [Sulfurimonas sp.]
MRIVFMTLVAVIFTASIFALDNQQKYHKVISTIEKNYYLSLSENQIISKGLLEFVNTTSLLSKAQKKKIYIKFKSYNTNKKINIIKELLVQNLFSKEEIYEILINETMKSLDANSNYLDKKHMQSLKIQTEGVYGGLGLRISKKNSALTVLSFLHNSPAFKAGIQKGDILLKINDFSSENISLSEAANLMRGKVNTSIKLTILRNAEIRHLSVIRNFIQIKSVDAKKLSNDILYLKILTFDKHTLEHITKQMKENLDSTKSIIIDLRNNPGGLLTQAVGIADLFMNRGNIITQKGRSNIAEKIYNASKENTLTNLPLVVLINKESSSAAEILGGALKMHNRATLIGEKSFGKGNVQAIFPINKEESIKLTVAQYLLADGNSIHNIGIKPDYNVNTDIVDGYDLALDKAQEYLSNQKLKMK